MPPGAQGAGRDLRRPGAPELPCRVTRSMLPESQLRATEREHADRCQAGSPSEQCQRVPEPRAWT
eukprot:7288731-Lingulodinium_polyedra.AAC.1